MEPKKNIKIGLVQYPLQKDFQKNWETILKILNQIKISKPDCIVLPEMFLGCALRDKQKTWKAYQQIYSELSDWCLSNQIECVGSGFEKKKNRFFNTQFWINSQGRFIATYQKLHLFRFFGEHKIYTPGKSIKTVQTKWGHVGLAICYDIRFPEMIRKMTAKGISMLFVSAQWPESRRKHWQALLTARAIENQIVIVAVNRLGAHKNLNFVGDSLVIDAWGNSLIHLDSKQSSGVVLIEKGCVSKIRKKYPFLKDRRFV